MLQKVRKKGIRCWHERTLKIVVCIKVQTLYTFGLAGKPSQIIHFGLCMCDVKDTI